MTRIGIIQFTATADIQSNIQTLETMIRDAAGQGAEFILTPECSDLMTSQADKLEHACTEDHHPVLPVMKALAADLGIWLQIGSIVIKQGDKLYNRSYMISNQGSIVARYDKIHLFDSNPGDGHIYKESSLYKPGNKAIIAKTPLANIGMTICYDLRFSTLYRHLAKQGAHILTVPAAFTIPTGEAHWEVLLRARAIETGCYVIAANQTGEHRKALHTYGHSMIINPWGKVIAKLDNKPGILLAGINREEVNTARAKLPGLQHDRSFS